MYRFIFLFGVCFAAAPDTLRMVNVLYRHGDRSPMTLYPTDPHKLDVWPQGLGWLSKIGMRQQYALGQWLRSEYGNILSAAYNNTEIRVDASDVNRCLMSAYCNLAGLYPPNGTQVWNDKLLWQPIPVHTRPEYEDNTLAMDAKCPQYDELYAAELRSDVVTEEERVNAEFYKFLENKTGMVRENITDVWEVADTLFCEKCHNLTLPTWTQQMWKDTTVYNKLMNLSHWGFDLLYNGTQITRLKGGPLLKEFIFNMNNFVSDPTGQHFKMHMYSAHDSTVAAVTGAMSVFNKLAPPYAATVLVELHQVDADYCVLIRYRNDSTVDPYTLQHPACTKACCPLARFVEVTKDRIPGDWHAECFKSDDSGNVNAKLGTAIGVLVGFIVLLILLALLSYAYCHQRSIVKNFERI